MARYRLSPRARRDLLATWRHIAEDSEIHADRFIDRLIRAIEILGQNPYIGRKRDTDLRTGLYSFPVENYLVVYRVEGHSTVVVLHVLHGRRDLPAVLAFRKG